MRVTIRIVACAVLWTVAGYATAAVNIDKVTVEAGRVTIQGNTEESHGVVVRIDWHEKPIEWRSWGGGTVFEVVVEASNKISLGGGKTSHGFVVTVKHGASKTGGNTINVALTEGNPVVGTFAIRRKADLVTKDGVLTFADVTLKDGKKLPVSFRLKPKVVLANPPAMPTPGAAQDDPKADSLFGADKVTPESVSVALQGDAGGEVEGRAVAPHAQPEDKVHLEWLAKIVKEAKTIKIGMSRGDVENILVEDVGGFSNPKAMRYQHPRCPYVKLDLEFELATSGDRKDDKVAKRSVVLLDLIPNRARW